MATIDDINNAKKRLTTIPGLPEDNVLNKAFGAGMKVTNPALAAADFISYQDQAKKSQDIKPSQIDVSKSYGDILSQLQPYRQKALDQGAARGADLFGQGSLGRIEAKRSGAMQDVINQLQSKSKGWSDPEAAARKEQALRGISGQLATNLRQARANTVAGGMRGAIASAQQQQALKAAQQARAQAEQGLMVSGEEAARQGLQSYYQGLSQQEAQDLAREQFNIAQQNKEKMARLATELGYGQLAGTDIAAAGQMAGGQSQADLAIKLAQAQQPGLLGYLSSLFS